MRKQCRCELGGDCDKTTVCAMNNALEELEESIREHEDLLAKCAGTLLAYIDIAECGQVLGELNRKNAREIIDEIHSLRSRT